MAELKLTCEVITPLFLGGADARVNPELRVPALRGAMRYWYRAALGGAIGDSNPQVRRSEAEVFGDTSQASAITLKIDAHTALQSKEFRKQPPIRRTGASHPHPTGRDYLYWSMAESGRREAGNYLSAREFIPPTSQFDITLATRYGAQAVDRWLKEAVYSLWLLLQLGGLGARSRRCAGSLAVHQASDAFAQVSGLKLNTPANAEALKSQLEEGLKLIRNTLRDGRSTQAIHHPASFDVIAEGYCRIWIIKGSPIWRDEAQAIEGLGASLRDYRSADAKGRADHDAVLDWFAHPHTRPTLQRIAFGLPIPFRYSDGGPRDVIEGSKHDRRASPLHMRVSRLQNEYVGVLTLFKSQFLSPSEQIKLHNKRLQTNPPNDYKFIEQFVTTQFKQHWQVAIP